MIKNERGFTLIELIVAMAIGVIMMGSLYKIFSTTDRTFKTQNEMVIMEQNIRAGLDTIIKELRMAGYNNNSPGTRSLNAFTGVVLDTNNNAAGITFVYDGNTVTFRLDQNGVDAGYRDANHRRLMRQIVTPADTAAPPFNVIAENINTLQFTFFDFNGTVITSASVAQLQTRAVQISITGGTEKMDTSRGNYRSSTMTSYIVPRNLAY